MALIDEEKLQGRVYNILEVLRKDIDCCKVVSTTWANSSIVGAGVFITIDQKGNITVSVSYTHLTLPTIYSV